MSAIRIVLADDHTLVRAGMRALLGKLPDVEVVGEASHGRKALELVKATGPDILLLDISMEELGGLEVLPRLVKEFPNVRVLILSGHESEVYVLRALRGGAAGYMVKDAAAEELGLAIKAIARGQTYLSPSISQLVVGRCLDRSAVSETEDSVLTTRQREIVQLIGEGKNTKEIAFALGISVKTVEAHRSQLMDRLGIHDIPGIVRFAIRTGLVSAEK
jgi:DNA-binding NarL/FixJ family response regulator